MQEVLQAFPDTSLQEANAEWCFFKLSYFVDRNFSEGNLADLYRSHKWEIPLGRIITAGNG